jgi:sugar phosphate isomerase/epimerase
VDALKELAPIATSKNVVLALEPMHASCAERSTFLISLDEAVDVLHRVESPMLKLVFDSYYWGHEPDILLRIPSIAPHIGLVQLGDSRELPNAEQNRCRLEEGIIPLRELVAAFSAAGYEGFYDVELLGEDLKPRDYAAVLEHSLSVFHQLADCQVV